MNGHIGLPGYPGVTDLGHLPGWNMKWAGGMPEGGVGMLFGLLNRLIERLEGLDNERGATIVEYALLVALIAVALIFSLDGLREAIASTFSDIVAEL
ncbi:MAG TPA: Flp family type IVb pilin [Actinomycetota bacterium]|nr:Flp family type IVb pilin [Actinomycetota bacterium]